METQRISRAPANRQPLGDASWRVNSIASDRGSGTKDNPYGEAAPAMKGEEAARNRSSPGPLARQPPPRTQAQSPSLAGSVHTEDRMSIDMTQGSSGAGSYGASEAKRESRGSNASSVTSSGRLRKSQIGPWQLGKTLGKGSSARVRAARHRATHQYAAVKIVTKNTAHLTQAGSLAKLDKLESSLPPSANGLRHMPLALEREVAILKLIEHPNIVRLYDIWENRSEIYLVLEFVDKGDLFEFINWQGRLREEEAIYYFRQIMSAIQYCHSLNICHRDLKPENILLNSDGQVKIADFGMAALHQSPSHHLRTACGSPHYAAPELLKQRMYKGESADLWSMGVILFAMLAGRLPFDEPDMHEMLEKAKRAEYTMPSFLSAEARDLINRILQAEPHRRISMAQMWRHPLIRKYDYLDKLNENGGQPPDIRRDAHLTPLGEEDIDPQILRQLRSVWHAFSEQDLKAKLLNNRPNDEKLFYRLLYTYRSAQLENYTPNVAHSKSDFHHLRPPNLGKRIATCQFTQPGKKGHARNISRFTVISNIMDAEAVMATPKSYDPYNASRVLKPGDTPASHTKIIIHRNMPEPAAGPPSARQDPGVVHSYRSYRSLAGPLQQRKRTNSQRSATMSQLRSTHGSIGSLQSNWPGTPRVHHAHSRHRRGVDFSGVKKRHGEAQGRGGERSRVGPASIAGDSTTYGRDNLSPPTPRKKAQPRSATTARTMADISRPRDDSLIWNEEVKQLGETIAEHCDEAFGGSILASSSGEVFDIGRQSTSLSFTIETASTAHFSKAPSLTSPDPRPRCHGWDSRPLPPIPRVASASPQKAEGDALGGVGVGVGAEVEAISTDTGHVADRRVVSAPVYSQFTRDVRQLPSIHEHTMGEPNKGRTVSAPAEPSATPPSRSDRRGLEYLSRVEKTIRLVDSPTATGEAYNNAALVPKPLDLRKKSSGGTFGSRETTSRHTCDKAGPNSQLDGRKSRLDAREQQPALYGHQQVCQGNSRTPSQGSGSLGGATKKKTSSWFRRASKDSVNDASFMTEKSSRSREISLSVVGNQGRRAESSSASETATLPVPRKKGFSLAFWKTGKSEPKMSLAGPNQQEPSSPESEHGAKLQHGRLAASPAFGAATSGWYDNDAGGRKIEVQQNWLARLFRVKPATRYLCFTISRRRARQEIAILLKDWRRYGMKDVTIDKSRDTVFARVGAKNYLDIKEVSFAAEVMTVIEHGKRQHLSIVRFTQEKGAASSFHKVVDTMHTVFDGRNILVAEQRKAKMMIKTLNS